MSARYGFRPERSCATRMRADRPRPAGSPRRCRRRRRRRARAPRRAARPRARSSERRAGHAAAGAAAADRRHAARARPSRDGRTRRAGRRARARRGRRPTAATRSARALPARPAPSRRRRLAVAREQPRDVPVTAVLPTRLPVPITASDGSSNGWKAAGRSGSRRRRTAARARGRATRTQPPLRRQDRRVRKVDDDLGVAEAPRRSARRSPAAAQLLGPADRASRRRTRTGARASASRTTSG